MSHSIRSLANYCDFIIVHVVFRLFYILAGGAYFFAPDCGINEGSDLLLSDNLFEKSDDELKDVCLYDFVIIGMVGIANRAI